MLREVAVTVAETVLKIAKDARAASRFLRTLDTARKNAALEEIARSLDESRGEIAAANAQDVADARAAGYPPALVDRLALTPERFAAMVRGVREVAALPDPVGETVKRTVRPNGLEILKTREPFGVVAVIFESRPNVGVDTAALCLKTSNAIILRGGKEAARSNAALSAVLSAALARSAGPAAAAAVQSVPVQDHEAVRELVRLPEYVDVAIPRGGERLIRAVTEAALVPVLKHYKGVCHVYVDAGADLDMALELTANSKAQRPSACNAAECLLVHEAEAAAFLPRVREWARKAGVVLHESGCDFSREFLSLEMNVAVVKSIDEAIAHVNAWGSHHSDAIVTRSEASAERFLRDVDSAAVYVNASTRFTDGAEFGMGAEIGISTDKLHARGPMGLEELTTYKYRIKGSGQCRS